MKLYQLFKSVPNETFMTSFLECYGLRGLTDTSEFSKAILRERRTIERLEDLLPEIILYYIPCKARKYLTDITEDRAITILRQFLRLYDYELSKKERVVQKKKIIYYSLQRIHIKPIYIHTQHEVLTLD